MKPDNNEHDQATFHVVGAAILFTLVFAFTGGTSVYASSASGDWRVMMYTLPGVLVSATIVSAWAYTMIWGDLGESKPASRTAPAVVGNLSPLRVSRSLSPASHVA